MTAKEYLAQAKAIGIELRRLEEQIEYIRSTAEGAVSTFLPFKPLGGVSKNKIEDAVEKIEGIAKKYITAMAEFNRLYTEIAKKIDAVPDEKCKALLTYRYLNGLTWEKIAEIMAYSYQYVCDDLHKKALSYIKI